MIKSQMLLHRQGQLDQCVWPPLFMRKFPLSHMYQKKVKFFSLNLKLLLHVRNQMFCFLPLLSSRLPINCLNKLQCLVNLRATY